MYTHAHTCTYMYAYTCTNSCTRAHGCIHIPVCIHVCTHTFAHTCIHTHLHVYAYLHMLLYLCIHLHVHISHFLALVGHGLARVHICAASPTPALCHQRDVGEALGAPSCFQPQQCLWRSEQIPPPLRPPKCTLQPCSCSAHWNWDCQGSSQGQVG